MNVHITRWVSVAGLASVVLALVAGAHDNNTVHHLITKEAGEALRMSDQVGGEGAGGAYAELYAGFGSSTGQKYWGDGVMLTQSEAETDAAAGFAAFRRVPLNVIDGSVLEDQPVRRVFSHFHHGYNAKTMDPSGVLPDSATLDRSPIDAFRYFDQAIEVFDYAEDGAITQASTGAVARADSGKSLAFWLLGHALHLVEDLSSPAHVQNDAHLTVDFWHLPSDDAFEGQYLPTLMWAAAENSNQARKVSAQALLEGMRSSIPINVASFEGIWPQPHVGSMELSASKKLFANSLARGTYNLSVYHAWLQVPGWLPVNPSPCPTGELAEMLNGPGSSCGPDSVLYRDDFSRQWMIEGVGGYSYSPGSHAYDSWWPVSPPYQPMAAYQGPHVLPEQGPGSYYYLEDLNDGERFGNGSDPMIDAKLLTPVGVRRNFELPWNPAASSNLPANPVVPNTKPLVQLMAEHILPQGAAHVAGFAQYWYDIANPPPYLKRVVVHQGDVVCYEASWKDVMASRSIVLANKDRLPASEQDNASGDLIVEFSYVQSRELIVAPAPQFVSPHKPFLIELEFSEPVQAPLDETFALTFDGTALPSGAFTVTELQPEASLRADPWQRQRRWLVDVRSPPVVLEGRVRLGVRAFDRNYHFTSPGSREYGTENDADPRTPARRMRVRAGLPRDPYLRDRDLWDDFTWHGPNSRDVNYPEADVPVGGFAYDRRPNGDESHYLLFDPTAPTGSATVSYPSLN